VVSLCDRHETVSSARVSVFLLIVLGILPCCGGRSERPTAPLAQNGAIDLRAWNFSRDGVVRLDGKWLWYWQQLISPGGSAKSSDSSEIAAPPIADGLFYIPQIWNGRVMNGKALSGNGYATFRLKVRLSAGTRYALLARFCSGAYRLYVNDQELAVCGTLGKSRDTTVSGCSTKTPTFVSNGSEDLITLQVANFHHTRGGPRSGLMLGSAEQIRMMQERRLIFDGFVFGGLGLISIYSLTNFLLRRGDAAPLYLAVCCGLLSMWIGMQGPLMFSILFPRAPWNLLIRLEYLGLYLAPVAVGGLVRSLYPREAPRFIFDSFAVMFCGLAATVFLAPPWLFTKTLGAYTALVNLFACLCLIVSLRAALRRQVEAALSVLGFAPMWGGVIIDAVATFYPQNFEPLTPLGMLFLILTQALLLARRSARAHMLTEAQAYQLVRLNAAYYRFVPKEFLRLLGKDDITSVQLGDQVQREMTVLFADVRDFTALSERMTPEENFAFVNQLLLGIGPLIRKHRGFIDKYMGDGIMALFPGQPADAVRASLEIHVGLARVNARRRERGESVIRVGVGVHCGSLMLGTVGEPQRMDGTVISDVVNTAARIESLTKTYGVTVLLSEQVVAALPPELVAKTRVLGRVNPKGKTTPITVFELFDDAEK
jgi:adenylate cyclase